MAARGCAGPTTVVGEQREHEFAPSMETSPCMKLAGGSCFSVRAGLCSQTLAIFVPQGSYLTALGAIFPVAASPCRS